MTTVPAQTCTVCGASAPFEGGFEDVALYRCPKCDHCFSDFAKFAAMEAYTADYFDDTHKNWFDHPNVALFEWIDQRLSDLPAGAAILDVGCGRGDFLKHLRDKKRGWRLVGVDLSPNEPVEGIEFLQADILKELLPQKFDAIVNLAVIEHVVDINAFVERLAEMTVPGGRVITMTLNDRSVLYEAARLANKFGVATPYRRLYSKHHLNHFNTSSLPKLFERHGLAKKASLNHNIPLAAVDMPPMGVAQGMIFQLGVWGTFSLGKMLGKTYLQTLDVRKSMHNGN